MLYKWEFSDQKMVLLQVSIGITFVQFCAIVAWTRFDHMVQQRWPEVLQEKYEIS
jgi:hypothetical protein